MDPVVRATLVGRNVRSVLAVTPGPPAWDGDYDKTFQSDLHILPGAFAGLLDSIADAINADTDLKPTPAFVIDDHLDRPGERPFAEEFYPKSVSALILRVSDTLGLPPYNL